MPFGPSKTYFFDLFPGQLASLPAQLVAQTGEFFFFFKKFFSSSQPFCGTNNFMG